MENKLPLRNMPFSLKNYDNLISYHSDKYTYDTIYFNAGLLCSMKYFYISKPQRVSLVHVRK